MPVRILQEPNHHKTYVLLLDTLGHKELSKVALKTTYYYCRSAAAGPCSCCSTRLLCCALWHNTQWSAACLD